MSYKQWFFRLGYPNCPYVKITRKLQLFNKYEDYCVKFKQHLLGLIVYIKPLALGDICFYYLKHTDRETGRNI